MSINDLDGHNRRLIDPSKSTFCCLLLCYDKLRDFNKRYDFGEEKGGGAFLCARSVLKESFHISVQLTQDTSYIKRELTHLYCVFGQASAFVRREHNSLYLLSKTFANYLKRVLFSLV